MIRPLVNLRGVLPTALLLALVWSPAQAEDQFAKGCQLYNARSYSQALPIFKDTVAKFPNSWVGHYYLAHTLLALGQRSAAKKEYEACMVSQPPPGPDTMSACQKVLATLGGSAVGSGSAATSTTSSSSSSSEGGGDGDDEKKEAAPETPREKDKQDRIARLRKECNDKIAIVKEEMKERMAQSGSDANQRWRYPDGSIKVALSPEEEAAIEKEYQEKINHIRQEYERRISAIH